MAVEIMPLIGKSLAIGFALFILLLLCYFAGLHKQFILTKHKNKLGDAKVFMATLDLKFPPSETMDHKLREERVRQMIKSGFPMIVLEKAQKLITKDKLKLNKEVNKNGIRLQKQNNNSGTTGTTTTTNPANGTTTSGVGSNGGDKELEPRGILPISSTPIVKRNKSKLKWNWDAVKSSRTSN